MGFGGIHVMPTPTFHCIASPFWLWNSLLQPHNINFKYLCVGRRPSPSYSVFVWLLKLTDAFQMLEMLIQLYDIVFWSGIFEVYLRCVCNNIHGRTNHAEANTFSHTHNYAMCFHCSKYVQFQRGHIMLPSHDKSVFFYNWKKHIFFYCNILY